MEYKVGLEHNYTLETILVSTGELIQRKKFDQLSNAIEYKEEVEDLITEIFYLEIKDRDGNVVNYQKEEK